MQDLTDFIDAHVTRVGPVEQVHVRPWSTLWRAVTMDGDVWLKATGVATSFEAGLYTLLPSVVGSAVLTPLAVDVERGWILLPDGGSPLGQIVDAMPAYARMQRALEGHVGALLALGVADMRAEVMPARFEEALAAVEPRADRSTFARLSALRGEVASWCEELAGAPGEPTLDHNDLHSGNVLPGPRFYDWGDSVIAHPFASLLVADLPSERDAYLAEFADLAPRAELDAVVSVAVRVARIARCLVWQRAIEEAPDGEFSDAPFRWLATLLD